MSSHITDSHLDEKHNSSAEHVEHVGEVNEYKGYDGEPSTTKTPGHADIDYGFDPAEVKATMRKVDLRLMPIMAALYTVSAMDRANLAYARAANEVLMDKQLGTNLGNRYSIITLLFFVPYIIFEVPSQIGLRKFGVRYWLGGSTILWGVIMLCMGFANNWQTLAALRALLGIFEATLFPGCAFLVACWYPRRNMASRMTWFFQAALTFTSFSAILSWGISHMNGRSGKPGWQWIFLLYGVITIAIGLVAIIVLVDFPDKATFLTEKQRHIVQTRIERDRADSIPDPLTLAKCWVYIREPRPWLFGFMFCSAALTVYALAYFLPSILASMGFNNMEVQLLSTPPNFWALFPALLTAWISDRYKLRGQMVMLNAAQIILGVALFSQLPKSQKAARYVGVFFAAAGSNSNVPLVTSWAQTGIRQQSRRAFTSAFIIAWGGIGGILASVAFRQQEAKMVPQFPTGIYVTIGMAAGTFAFALGLMVWFKRQNRRADRGEVILEGEEGFRYQ